ncbi:MAG: rhodanese-like domain-containing protein [Bacteroidetes bacterium]|nr:rhodanese-like domain-containing protein [Bacteroidota bacterium]
MFSFLKNMISGSKTNYKELVSNGAMIVDVRTKGEFAGGHIPNSMNIPLQELQKNLKKFKKDMVIITCCASGMRSASAKSILKSAGISEVYNGGGWASLQNKLR